MLESNLGGLGVLRGVEEGDDDVLFIGTRFSNLYTAVDTLA